MRLVTRTVTRITTRITRRTNNSKIKKKFDGGNWLVIKTGIWGKNQNGNGKLKKTFRKY